MVKNEFYTITEFKEMLWNKYGLNFLGCNDIEDYSTFNKQVYNKDGDKIEEFILKVDNNIIVYQIKTIFKDLRFIKSYKIVTQFSLNMLEK